MGIAHPSVSLITSSDWPTHTTRSSDHLPILIILESNTTSSPARHRTCINLKKNDCTGYRQEIERKLSSRYLPTDCQKDEKLFRTTLLKASFHHIPNGRRKLYTQQVPQDHRTDSTKLWRTIKGIDGKSKQTEENEGITFIERRHTSLKLIANSVNSQFIIYTLGKHSSSRRTRPVLKDVKRMYLEEAESFTSDRQATSTIKSCRSIRTYCPDSLSIFH